MFPHEHACVLVSIAMLEFYDIIRCVTEDTEGKNSDLFPEVLWEEAVQGFMNLERYLSKIPSVISKVVTFD